METRNFLEQTFKCIKGHITPNKIIVEDFNALFSSSIGLLNRKTGKKFNHRSTELADICKVPLPKNYSRYMDLYLKFDYVIGLEAKCKFKNEIILDSFLNHSGIE